MTKRVFVKMSVLTLSLLLIAGMAFAAFPTKAVTLVVPWGAGGITDRVARVFAPLFEKNLGVSVAVVNKPGASGAIGTEFVNSAKADGYTVMFSAETPGIFQVMGFSNLNFADFDALMMMVQDTKVIVVPKNSAYNSMEDLVADIKARPGKVRLSYSGPGASGHIQGLLFKEAGLNVSMTPFGGGSPALLATISGQVDFTFANVGTALDYIKTGELKPLGVFAAGEVESLPGVPSMIDSIPELEPYLLLRFPNCLMVKKGTPAEVEATLLKAAQAAVQEPEWLEFTDSNYYERKHDLLGEAVSEYWDDWTSLVSWLLYDAGATKYSPEKFGIEKFR